MRELIGERLYELRKSHGGITQATAARLTGVNQRMWQRWEKGQKSPNAASQRKIREAFNLQDDFFSPVPKVVQRSDVEIIKDQLTEMKDQLTEIEQVLKILVFAMVTRWESRGAAKKAGGEV